MKVQIEVELLEDLAALVAAATLAAVGEEAIKDRDRFISTVGNRVSQIEKILFEAGLDLEEEQAKTMTRMNQEFKE